MGDDDKGLQPTAATPGKRETGGRRGFRVLPRAVGIVFIAVLAAGVGAVSARLASADAPPGGANQPQSSSAPTTVTTPLPQAQTVHTPRPLTPDSQLTPSGIGPIVLGMTPEEAERISGVTLVSGQRFGNCWFADPDGLDGVSFMVLNDSIFRVDVSGGRTATPEGIRVGSTEQDVFEAYPGHIVASDRLGQRLLIYIPARFPADIDFATKSGLYFTIMVFESDGHQVTGMKAGTFSTTVEAYEGCN